MFEQLCALLLRRYPAEFQRAYGREAWQLIRDRARDERSATLRLRLLYDLVSDLFATSLQRWHGRSALMAAAESRDGTPRFHIIEVQPRRPEWYAAGMLSSMLMFASFTFLFQPANFPNAPGQLGEGSGGSESDAPFDPNVPQQQPGAVDPAAERRKIIEAVAAKLRERYADRAIGQQLSNALLAQEKNRDFESARTGPELAERLTNRIHDMSRALGVPAGEYVGDVIYSTMALPDTPPPPPGPAARQQYRIAVLKQNCHFETIEMLPNNIGYVRLLGFADIAACEETTRKAMLAVNDAAALIVDLRDNGGGYGESALQIAGYFFKSPTFLYDPRPNSPVPSKTTPVADSKLTDRPVYVLTSSRTQSAAEYFVYNLKMLKRATIVGERTAGHQHSGAFHRITDHIGMGVQEEVPPANPYDVKGWETIGVEPDVKVSKAEALEIATKLAASRSR